MTRPNGSSIYVRNVIFGIEDSMAATVGLLAGLASEGTPLATLILTGFVYIFVEAFSMGIGSFLSEESAEEYDGKKAGARITVYAAIAMFVSCIFGGFVPFLPYFFFSGMTAIIASVIASLTALGILGFVHARISKRRAWPRVLRMMILGGTAILVGVLVGQVVGAA